MRHGFLYDRSTIGKEVVRMCYTSKKVTVAPPQRDGELRMKHVFLMDEFSSNQLLYVDEVGMRSKLLLPNKGRSMRGKPAHVTRRP